MRRHIVRVRLVAGDRPGRKPIELDVVEVRRLLRTDLSLEDIATQLGCSRAQLYRFIKQRNLCDLWARRKFNALQRTLTEQS